jgi:hypothetical protein
MLFDVDLPVEAAALGIRAKSFFQHVDSLLIQFVRIHGSCDMLANYSYKLVIGLSSNQERVKGNLEEDDNEIEGRMANVPVVVFSSAEMMLGAV